MYTDIWKKNKTFFSICLAFAFLLFLFSFPFVSALPAVVINPTSVTTTSQLPAVVINYPSSISKNYSNYYSNSTDYWDNLDVPSDILGSEYWINWNSSGFIINWSNIISGGDNTSWNQSLANTLYSPIGAGNSSWNESYANTLYSPVLWAYNQTEATYDKWGLWWYNMTTPAIEWTQAQNYLTSYTETDPSWSGNYTAFNSSWSSTYNATYAAYNSTGLIKDWNASSFIKDWNSSGFITNWSGSFVEADPYSYNKSLNISGTNVTKTSGTNYLNKIYDWIIDQLYDLIHTDNLHKHDASNITNEVWVNTTGDNMTGNLNTTGNVTANYFIGNGSKLTGIDLYVNESGDTMTGNLNFTADKGIKTLVGARAYLSANQNAASGDWTLVNLDSESYDLGNDFNTATHRFVAPVSGYYYVSLGVKWDTTADGKAFGQILKKNGAFSPPYAYQLTYGTGSLYVYSTDILYLAANDYIELYAYQNSGSDKTLEGGELKTALTVFLLSVA